MLEVVHLLAAYGDPPSLWTGRLIALGAVALLIAVPVIAVRMMRGGRDSHDVYSGIQGVRAAGQPGPGEVRLIFHTYSGLLIFVVQRTHDVVLPAEQAKVLLDRLFRHNLTWGLLAYGVLVIPILSYFEFRRESAKIAAALQRGFPVAPR